MCQNFNISVAKPAKCGLNGLVSAILHWISSNSFTKETSSLPFQLSFPRPLPLFTFIVALYLRHKLSMKRFSFPLFTVLSKLPYSVLHTLLDCISPPRPSPRHLPEHFFHHFLVCRVCLHMALGGVPHIRCWVF